ncbi:MAG: hypothetical protein ACREQ5_10110 [Candidatus Dormibacteria bacterium]
MLMSQTQERQVASRLATATGHEAVVQPGSGNQPGAPNDILVRGHSMIECKATAAAQITLRQNDLSAARMKAALCGGWPTFLALRMGGHDYFVLEDSEFYHLLNCERVAMAPRDDQK